MKLEAGRQYKARTGKISTPLRFNRHDRTFSGELDRKRFRWSADGTFGWGDDSDWVLVALAFK